MDVLRTPDERFEGLPDFGFSPTYVDVRGLRMHAVDVGQGDPILCLHGEPSWSFLYRKMIPVLETAGRVVAPDLIGFGRSDKPTQRSAYTFETHLGWLRSFVEALDLKRITLVCQDWGGLLGLTLASQMTDRFARVVAMNTGLPTGEEKPNPAFEAWRDFAAKVDDMDIGRIIQSATVSELSDDVVAGYNAPYPDKRYKTGAHHFPLLVPTTPDHPSGPPMKQAREVYRAWEKPFLTLFSDSDPITSGGDRWFRKIVPSALQEPHIVIAGGGHFLQEDKGGEIAGHIVDFIHRRPV
jgi:haloalkane dehalogenase